MPDRPEDPYAGQIVHLSSGTYDGRLGRFRCVPLIIDDPPGPCDVEPTEEMKRRVRDFAEKLDL